MGGSANSSPTLSRKKLSKDEKRKLKEMEKLEREQKRKNELRMKNKQKGLKAHKVCVRYWQGVDVYVIEATPYHTEK